MDPFLEICPFYFYSPPVIGSLLFPEKCLYRITSEEEFKKTIEKIPDYRIKEEKVKMQKSTWKTTHIYECYTIAKRGRASIGSRKKADIRRKDFREKVVRGGDGGGGGATSEAGTRRGGTWEGGLAHDVQPSKVSLLSDPPIMANNWGDYWALLDPPAQ